MKPDLLKFEGDYKDRLTIVKVDVRNRTSAEYKEYAPINDSKYVPHIILIDKDKKVLAKNTGGMTGEKLAEFVKPYLK